MLSLVSMIKFKISEILLLKRFVTQLICMILSETLERYRRAESVGRHAMFLSASNVKGLYSIENLSSVTE